MALRSNNDGAPADTGAFDHRLSIVEDLLRWSLDRASRGGGHPLTLSQLSAERGRLAGILTGIFSVGALAGNLAILVMDFDLGEPAAPLRKFHGALDGVLLRGGRRARAVGTFLLDVPVVTLGDVVHGSLTHWIVSVNS